jgi:Leucine-rich repeat (LRR) protein
MSNNLRILDFDQNQITEIDSISFPDNLFSLSGWGNLITEINTTLLPTSLVELNFSNNPLITLDVSPLVNLYLLSVSNCQLTTLEFGESPLTSFGELYCNNNNLTELDVSSLTNLSFQLHCSNNQLISLNLKNGALNINEGDIYDSHTSFGGNPDLNYICADDFEIENMDYTVDEGGEIITVIVNGVQQMANNYGYTDATVTSDCTLSTNDSINVKFEVYPNPVKDILTIKGQDVIEAITIFDVSGRLINQVSLNGNQNQIEISTSNLTRGTYFIKVKMENGTGIEKLIKD